MISKNENDMIKALLVLPFTAIVLFPLLAYGIFGIPLSFMLLCVCASSLIKG